MKKVLSIILIAAVILTFFGCGKKNGKSEKNLKADLTSNEMFTKYKMNLDTFEIVKRQTIPETRTDCVWVKTEASNEQASGVMYFVMNYNLYNSGWILESVNEDRSMDWEFKPLRGIEDDELAEIIKNEFFDQYGFEFDVYVYDNGAEWISAYSSYDEETYEVRYKLSRERTYCTETYTVVSDVKFGENWAPGSGEKQYWYLSGDPKSITHDFESWNIEGHWESGDGKCTLDITKNEESGKKSVELYYEADYYTLSATEESYFSSFGSENAEISSDWYMKHTIECSVTNSYGTSEADSYLYLYPDEGITLYANGWDRIPLGLK